MELTKEQIKFIDHRLENEGIKYWDIRIEMLDHVVSDVESILKPENSAYEFKEIVQQSFEKLGWKENFNGGGFESMITSRLKLYNKNRNKFFLKYIIEKLFSLKFIISISFLAVTVFYFQENKLILKALFFMLFGLYIAFILRFAFKYKVMYSSRLSSALFFATFPITIFNVIIYMPKVFLDYEISISGLSYFMIPVSALSAIGISYLNQEFKKAQKIYNQLIS
jgi:hypothetical protein